MWKMHTSRMGILNIVLFDHVEKWRSSFLLSHHCSSFLFHQSLLNDLKIYYATCGVLVDRSTSPSSFETVDNRLLVMKVSEAVARK